MKFDDFDAQMRQFETSLNQIVPEDVHIIARLDGRGFTRLTKRVESFERPFDRRFHDMMLDVARRLMQCGFGVAYAYLQSDEISLLFEPGDSAFNRNARKINSILAGEASAAFSLALGQAAVFDCRVCPLPSESDVVDYFRWRNVDAQRNALAAHCYWLLRSEDLSGKRADTRLKGLSPEQKRELLREREIDFHAFPEWQREGTGLVWRTMEIEGRNPLTGDIVATTRRRVEALEETPTGSAIGPLIKELLTRKPETTAG
jgi:tRNA(His) 5'-end guanylyltransferase